MHIKTEKIIHASKNNVWNQLVSFTDYPTWNRFITHIKGKLLLGQTLEVEISLPGKKPAIFKPKISYLEPGVELRWIGKIIFEFIFRGEHYFRLVKEGDRTKLMHGEKFSGLLAPLVLYFIKDATQKGFSIMNDNLEKVLSDAKNNSSLENPSLTEFILSAGDEKYCPMLNSSASS